MLSRLRSYTGKKEWALATILRQIASWVSSRFNQTTLRRGVMMEIQRYSGSFVALVGEAIKPQPPGRNHSNFGHGKKSIDGEQNENGDDFNDAAGHTVSEVCLTLRVMNLPNSRSNRTELATVKIGRAHV